MTKILSEVLAILQLCVDENKNQRSVTVKFRQMFQVKVNEKYDFRVDGLKSQVTIDDQPADFQVSPMDNGMLEVHYNGSTYHATLLEVDRLAKTMSIKVGNNIYALHVKDEFDQLLEKMGMHKGASARLNELKSPMPGLVLEIMVIPGQRVEKGDQLLILEAMKMENVLKSPGEGVVKEILVQKGAAVEKNAVLIAFE